MTPKLTKCLARLSRYIDEQERSVLRELAASICWSDSGGPVGRSNKVTRMHVGLMNTLKNYRDWKAKRKEAKP